MTETIVTETSDRTLGAHARLADGRFTLIQLATKGINTDSYDLLLERLSSFLSKALAEHHAAAIALLTGDSVISVSLSPADDGIMRPPSRSSGLSSWIPTRADGRDSSGQLHVSVTTNSATVLDVPQEFIQNARSLERALKEASNQAMERLDSDFIRSLSRRLSDSQLAKFGLAPNHSLPSHQHEKA